MKRHATLAAAMACVAALASAASAGTLPNGWSVHPAGAITPLGTMPLRMAVDPRGAWIAVTNGGYGTVGLAIVDAAIGRVADFAPLDGAFYGVAFSPDGGIVYATTAARGSIARFAIDRSTGALRPLDEWPLGRGDIWASGLAVAPDGRTVYAVAGLRDRVYAVDARDGSLRWSARTGAQPVAVAVSRDGSRLFVSNWAGSTVAAFDARGGASLGDVATAHHPNALAAAPDGRTVYVACANGSTVDVIDAKLLVRRDTIDAALLPGVAEGTTPDGLAVSSDGRTLYVADADENAVAVLDVSGRPRLAGAIPLGWYVTDVALSRDGKTLYALDGDGISGHSNPDFGRRRRHHDDPSYIAALATGDLERLPVPARAAAASGLAKVRRDAPAVPARAASAHAPVKHVIYVIKENRTYDQVLGDDPRGEGDATLAMFGRAITPNIHRLARDFVLLDRFEENSFVSADGHNWATAAYATDYVAKLWPANYSDRGRDFDFYGDGPSHPDGGYLWDLALAHGKSLRDYGEFVKPGSDPSTPEAASLAGHIDDRYRGWDLAYSDQSRMDEWEREFAAYVRDGDLPALEIVYLPDDHTAGTAPGYRSPDAMLASNDYALGRLVSVLSRSRYWKDTVVLVVEDDSQAGPDHVSDQRAEALIAGGPVRRGVVDHTPYTQCSVLATIEALLGLPPMSQFDARATLMTSLLGTTADARPWSASPPMVDLAARNDLRAPGARRSAAFDWRTPDAADPAALTRVLQAYARGRSR